MRFGLLGCGRIGKMHAGMLDAHPVAQLALVYDIDASASEAIAGKYGCQAAASAGKVLDDPDVDAVLIASATPTHADLIEQAAAAGKAVLCEKPVDLSAERAQACQQKLAGSNALVGIGFNRRYDPTHAACRAAIESGRIGTLRQVTITSRDPGSPSREYLAAAGGMMRDMTIHDFDLARFLLGEEPTQVFACANRHANLELLNELGEYDSAMIILRTASGMQCCIINHRVAVYGYDQRIEAFGSDGMVQSGNCRDHEMRLYDAQMTDARAPIAHFFIERYAQSYRNQLDSFVERASAGKQPAVTLDDGVRALVLAEAAYRSLEAGKMIEVEG